jgi:hypothetical protein
MSLQEYNSLSQEEKDKLQWDDLLIPTIEAMEQEWKKSIISHEKLPDGGHRLTWRIDPTIDKNKK